MKRIYYFFGLSLFFFLTACSLGAQSPEQKNSGSEMESLFVVQSISNDKLGSVNDLKKQAEREKRKKITLIGEMNQTFVENFDKKGKLISSDLIAHVFDRDSNMGYRFISTRGEGPSLELENGNIVEIQGQISPDGKIVIGNERLTSQRKDIYVKSQTEENKIMLIPIEGSDIPLITSYSEIVNQVESSKDYFEEVSYGRFTLDYDIPQTVFINSINSQNCNSVVDDEMMQYGGEHVDLVFDAVENQGYNLDDYAYIGFVLNCSDPWFSGLGSIGSRPYFRNNLIQLFEDEKYLIRMRDMGNVLWEVYSHELGHNLELLHAGHGGNEYGNTYDAMGSPNPGHFNGALKTQTEIPFIESDEVLLISPTLVYTEYTIGNLEEDHEYPKVARLGEYYLEYRQSTGFDQNIGLSSDGCLIVNELGIWDGDGGGQQTDMLDLSPGFFDTSLYCDEEAPIILPDGTSVGPIVSANNETITFGISNGCGNGVIDLGEACDDGNTVDDDACNNSCVSNFCGDGFVNDGEACDDGNSVNGDGCDNDCTITYIPECGNEMLDEDEQCDDGNPFNGDGCENDCTITYGRPCGNGLIDPGEACDEGVNNADFCNAPYGETCDYCSLECQIEFEVGPFCGDGYINPFNNGAEECDDGNQISTDACNNDCKVNPGYCFFQGLLHPGDGAGLYYIRGSPVSGININSWRLAPLGLIEDDYPPSGIGETYPLVPEYSDAMSMLVASQSRDELMDSYLISLEESFVQSVGSDFSMSGGFIPDFHNAYGISAISYGQNWLPSWVRSFRTRHNMGVDDPFSLDDVLTTQNGQYQGTHYPVGSTICNHQCGNGILEWGEECDDGGIEGGDGCDMLCKIEADVTCDDSLLQFDYNQDGTFNQYDIEYLRSYILHINIYTGTAENCDAEGGEYYEGLQYCCPEGFVCDLNCSGQVSTIDLAILAKLDAELVEIDELCFCE